MTQTVRVNEVEIAYQWDGVSHGPVVVLNNSLMSNFNMWDDTVPALADKYRVLRYDTRGHGRSGVTPGPYSIASLAEDLIALLDALKVNKAHVVGLSMGGMVAQYVGANYPSVYCRWACATAPAKCRRAASGQNALPAL